MQKIVIALDWTPNINHIGFFVARELGYYQDVGLEVKINDPSEDNYAVTPAKKVEMGQADFALCPMESIISYQTKENAFKLKAIATIFKEDLSAIVTLKESGLSSPKDLDNKVYASYQARYEDEIVKQMIRNDGGNGNIKIEYPEKLGIWETLLKNKSESTWVFMNWEGVHAIGKGIGLHAFRMKDYDIPYSYSPVIAANANLFQEKGPLYSKFLEATKRGFLYAQDNPDNATDIIRNHIAATDRDIDILACLKISGPALGNQQNWGIMDEGNVSKYLDWIYKHKLESTVLNSSDVSTNEFLT